MVTISFLQRDSKVILYCIVLYCAQQLFYFAQLELCQTRISIKAGDCCENLLSVQQLLKCYLLPHCIIVRPHCIIVRPHCIIVRPHCIIVRPHCIIVRVEHCTLLHLLRDNVMIPLVKATFHVR